MTVVVGLWAATWLTPAQALESVVTTAVYATDMGTADTSIRTVSYSTGQTGRKLKWHPYRPSKADITCRSCPPTATEPPAQFTQYTSPAQEKHPGAPPVDPFDDPFEDQKTVAEPLPLRTPLQDELLEGTRPESSIPGSLPSVVIEDPTLSREDLEAPGRLPGLPPGEPLVVGPTIPKDPCSSIQLTPINEITHDISAHGDMFPKECPLVEGTPPDRMTRGWAPITFTWKASALCSKPAYFEDVHLERYGHSFGPYLQPVISGAHFFLTVPVLPYKMGLYPPQECIYTLGYYRPGSCAPYMLDPLPLSIRAGLVQGAVWTGMPILIP